MVTGFIGMVVGLAAIMAARLFKKFQEKQENKLGKEKEEILDSEV